MAEQSLQIRSLEDLVNQIEIFLQTPDTSLDDVPSLCESFLSHLEQVTPADNVSMRDIRRLKSHLRVRLSQSRVDVSEDKSDQGPPPSSTGAEPPTDPLSVQQLSTELVLMKETISAMRSDRSPSPSISSKSGMSVDNQTKESPPPCHSRLVCR